MGIDNMISVMEVAIGWAGSHVLYDFLYGCLGSCDWSTTASLRRYKLPDQ